MALRSHGLTSAVSPIGKDSTMIKANNSSHRRLEPLTPGAAGAVAGIDRPGGRVPPAGRTSRRPVATGVRRLTRVVPGLSLLLAAPASAVINGEVDTQNRHPNVGCFVVVSRNGDPIEPFVFGSVTLIAPRVVLTAG